MTIQMIKQTNPENIFYIPYLQPVKAQIEMKIKEGKIDKIDLESFTLPKEAAIYADEQGIEAIYVDGIPVQIVTEIPSGIVYLLNKDTFLQMDRFIPGNSKEKIVQFPSVLNKAV